MASAAGAEGGWGIGQRRRISVDTPSDTGEDDEVEGRALLTERQQEPLCEAMDHLLTKKGVRSLQAALAKGAKLNSPYTDARGFDRLALHSAIDKTLRAETLEGWQCGEQFIAELLSRGANPCKLNGVGRTALAVLKDLPLLPQDAHNGKEEIVRSIATALIKAGAK